MKARIKSTGEIVEVEDLYDNGTALVNGGYFKVSELDFFDNFETIDGSTGVMNWRNMLCKV